MKIFNDPKFSKLSKYYYYTLLLAIACISILSGSRIFTVICLILSIVALTYFDEKLLKIYRNTTDLTEYDKLETEFILAKDELQKRNKENEELKRIIEDKELFLASFETDYQQIKEEINILKKQNENENIEENIDTSLEQIPPGFVLMNTSESTQIKWTDAKVLIILDDSADIPTDLLYDAEIIITKSGSILKNVFGPIGRIISNQD